MCRWSNGKCPKSCLPLPALAPCAGSRRAAPRAAPSRTALLCPGQEPSAQISLPCSRPPLFPLTSKDSVFSLFPPCVRRGVSSPLRREPPKHFEFWTVIQALTAPSTAPTNLTHDTTGAEQGTSKVSLTANCSARRQRGIARAGLRTARPCGDLTDTGRGRSAPGLLPTAPLLSASLGAPGPPHGPA